MKKPLLFLFVTALLSTNAIAQNPTDDQKLSDDEVAGTFTDDVKADYGIEYPIFRAYEYNDNDGHHYIVFTEKNTVPSKTSPRVEAISAFFFDDLNGSLTLNGTTSDRLDNEKNTVSEEKSIWFWTKFLRLEDLDNDGLVDPILVYGSTGINKYDDGRIVIDVNYKGLSYQIKHQNGTLDDQRETHVDEEFYNLPKEVQDKAIEIMHSLEAKNFAIFPAGWEEAMKNKKTEFNER